MTGDTYFEIVAFVFGAVIGSFLNVCIGRWPAELSVVRPRSRCPNCGHQLAWFENIPLLSWIVLRARCRCCDEPISVQYPLVELAVGILWALCVASLGPTLTALRVAVTATTLLGVAITDAKHYLIPDGFTLFGLGFTLVMAVYASVTANPGPFAGAYDAFIGACAGAGMIAIVGWLGELVFKKEAMGMGDMTLMAFVGAAVGPERAILTVFVGSAIGAVAFLLVVYPVAWLTRGRRAVQAELALGTPAFEPPLVPFGVFLAPAAVVTLLWGNALFARILGG
ncbi:MAG: prepilin peptidase [Gemmatimonadaceae bacterium]|nr:prepilin peptidase [Gemmatimonadaceae bacterium]